MMEMGLLLKTILLAFLHYQMLTLYSYPVPLNCTDTTRSCTSFIAFKRDANQSFPIVQSMFDVLPQHITVEEGDSSYVYLQKNCSCLSSTPKYLTNTTFTVRGNGGPVRELVKDAYHGLAVIPNTTRIAGVGAVVSVRLFCGCSSGLWNYLIAYVMGENDSLQSLASRFGVSMDSIEIVNGIANPDNITVGSLYYIPLNSVPGEPYSTEQPTNPPPVPAPLESYISANVVADKYHGSHGWIFGGVGIGIAILALAVTLYLFVRSSSQFPGASGRFRAKDPDREALYRFRGQTSSFWCHSVGQFCYSPGDSRHADGESSNRELSFPSVDNMVACNGVFNVEKPLIFAYDEIFSSTTGFSDSNLLGHGTYGSVYYGILRNQEVAIKKMFATKTKEFKAEMSVLCTVHHSNLVELIGYAASSDELFLIYEYAKKGSLAAHLHDSQNRGYPPLSWVTRVQIALDAARGIEYVHEHTKTHYVHRDIKTSNILLDNAFRAKISDFGLAKLVGRTNETEVSTTRVVGTFGYLAPEYLREGRATTKSDVYAFGIVLFEIISGRESVIQNSKERRSLASTMVAALRKTPNYTSLSNMKGCIDPNLSDLCPDDCVYKMAMLAKQCVDDDPVLRPDMKQVVISLSHILLSSVEWEATLAGNSQVFSGLVQGR